MPAHRVGPFEVESKLDQVKTAVCAGALIGAGEPILTTIARHAGPRLLSRTVRGWASVASRLLGMKVEVTGINHVDPSQSYVIAPLHEGFADALVLNRLPLTLRYLALSELFEWRHLGRFLKASGQIEVSRDAGGRDLRRVLAESRRVLENGESLVVFPQGSILGIEIAFTGGAFILADRLKEPLLPVVISGTHLTWEHPFSPKLRYGTNVSMEVLQPLEIGKAVASMSEIETRMKALALANQIAPARRFVPETDGFWDGYPYEIDPAFPGLAARIEAHRRTATLSTTRHIGVSPP